MASSDGIALVKSSLCLIKNRSMKARGELEEQLHTAFM
jgi:hypothetical protein